MSRKYIFLATFLCAVLAAVYVLYPSKTSFTFKPLARCQDKLGCVTIEPGEPLKIALLQPRSGRLKDSGTVQIRGVELALARRSHQLLGHSIELQIEDSKCSPEGGGIAALKVIADPKILGIIGTNCSGAAAQASKVMSEAGLVMISGTNSAASLTNHNGKQGADWYPGYFRTMFNAIKRGEAGAIFAFKELGITKAATIHDGDKRSMELTKIFEETFTKLGGQIVLTTAIDRQDTNMKPLLTRIASTKAELIFFPFFPPETVYITRQAREVPSLKNTDLMVCGSSMRSKAFLNDVGSAGKGMYFVGKAPLSGEAYERLKREYETRYVGLHNDILYAFASDALNILLNGIESVAQQEEDGTLHIGRQAMRDAIYKTKDFEGTTGKLSCDQFGDCGTPKFNILRLDNLEAGIEGLMKNEVFRYTPK